MTKLIPAPPLHTVLHHAADLVELYPNQTSQHAYLDNHGNPHSLVSHVIARAGGDVHGLTDKWNTRSLTVVWDLIFDEPLLLISLTLNRDAARAFLTYAFLRNLQDAQDTKRYAQWNKAVPRALREFSRFLRNPSSGFLVQTRGNFHGLQHAAVVDVALMLNRLNAK